MSAEEAISITGWGAVSPAGWTAASLREAVQAQLELPIEDGIRLVPAAERGQLPRSPRLRRTSPIAKFLTSACFEALGEERIAAIREGEKKIDVIANVLNGSVAFSARFYSEVLDDPSVASPLIFPETVFNAPSSHIAAIIGSTGPNETIVGDSAQFAASLETAAVRIRDGEADGVLVACCEESHWVSTAARQLYESDVVTGEGAAAVFLEKTSGPGIRLNAVSSPIYPGGRKTRRAAIEKARSEVDPTSGVLIDSTHDFGRTAVDEKAVWADWSGERFRPIQVLGDGMAASSGWGIVLGCELLDAGVSDTAVISTVGGNQQAVCAEISTIQ